MRKPNLQCLVRNELIPEDHGNFVPSFEDSCNDDPKSSAFTGGSHIPPSSTPSPATTQSMLEAVRFILKLTGGKGLSQTVTEIHPSSDRLHQFFCLFIINFTNDSIIKKVTKTATYWMLTIV